MSDKVKGWLSIFLMSVAMFMMTTTKYMHALGDYILEWIGLRAWTGDYRGTHLTVIYFSILFVIGLILVEKYAVGRLKIRRLSIFLSFMVLMTVFTSMTEMTVKNIKKNAPGLSSIGYNASESNIKYRYEGSKFTEFTAEFEVTNYSNEKKSFYATMDNPFNREDESVAISIWTFDGEQAIFELNGKESRAFTVSLDNYNIVGKMKFEGSSGSGGGRIEEMVLTNDKGDKVRLYSNYVYGVEAGKY